MTADRSQGQPTIRIATQPGIGDLFDVLCFPACALPFFLSSMRRGKVEFGIVLALAFVLLGLLMLVRVRRHLMGTGLDFYAPDWVVVRNGRGKVLAEGSSSDLGLFLGTRDRTTYLCAQVDGSIAIPLTPEEVKVLRISKLPDGAGAPRPLSATRPIRLAILAVAVGGIGYMDWRMDQQTPRPTPGQKVTGMFWFAKSWNPSEGVQVRACHSGRNQGGFTGVALELEAPLELVRFEERRSGSGIVTLQFRDKKRSAIGVPERECRSVSGETHVRRMRIRDRDLDFLEGEIRIDCPALGLAGNSFFRGCLPYGY